MKNQNEIQIYQAPNWEIVLNIDLKKETIWLNLNQISVLFWRNKSTISRHIKNIFNSWELEKKQAVAIFATTASDGKTYQIEYYNLDVILSVGYRVDSKQATKFRQRATKVLKNYIIKWYALNEKKLIEQKYEDFKNTIDKLEFLIRWKNIKPEEVVDLIKEFWKTWFNLENFDKWNLPESGFTYKDLKILSKDLYHDIELLKQNLLKQNLATELFAQEKRKWDLEWILWNVFATAFGKEIYSTIEEKASHLLYFIVKDHPFNDWNKRIWAFSFIRFLNKAWINFKKKINSETLTTLTLLIAQSNLEEKNKMIWLILQLLK